MKKIFSTFLFCILTGIICAENTNLASEDPGFEQGTKYWYFMKPEEYASFAKKGINDSNALEIQNLSGNPAKRGGLYRKGFVSVTPGKTYTFRVALKGKLTAGYASARINIFRKEGAKNKFIKTFETPRITGDPEKWTQLHCTFKVPDDGNLLHIELSSRNFCGTMLFDNASLEEGNGALKLPMLTQTPDINGKWDPVFEKQALRLHDFLAYPLHDDTPAVEKTEVLLGQTHDTIYGVILLHHDPQKKLKADCSKHDDPLWQDDAVEMFITQTNAPRPYYHFMLNTKGAVFDALENNANWNSNIKTACGKLNDSCDFIQFALPLKDIGYHAELDAHLNKLEWKMNFTRSHHILAGERNSQVRYSTFAKVISFHNPENFIPFTGLTGGKTDLVSVRYWNQGEPGDGQKINQQRYWKIEKPLYKELLSDIPNPLKGESAFIWGRPIDARPNTEFAIQYGLPYTQEMMLEEYRKNRLHPYSSPDFSKLAEWGRKTGVGVAVYAPYYLNNCSFLYDPEGNRKFLEALRSLLEKHHTGIWGVSFGDEVLSQALRRFITRANNPKELEKDQALLRAVSEIREKYGNGIHSVPKSLTSDEPFAWIAVRHWTLDRMLETQKEIHALCAQFRGVNGKPIKVISSDHVDWGLMQWQSRFGPWQDIATAQTLPSNDPNRQTIAYRAKLLRDLTGNNVWLCVHVEPYAGNYTSAETAAFLSEAARGGGTGLQIWNFDHTADQRKMGSSQFDYYGHRPRWNTIMDCVRRMREDNLLKFPQDDFAILVSNDTAFSHPKMRILHYESAFNLMGPGAGSWFRFISDVQLTDGKVSLDQWKLLVIPKGNIISTALAEKLETFLKKGGTVLCFDPDFMSQDPSGRSTSQLREKLFGAKTFPATAGYTTVRFSGKPPFEKTGDSSLAATGTTRFLTPQTNTEVLAVFPDGKAAVTRKTYPGGGQAILTAFELQLYQNADPQWRGLIRNMLASYGIKTGLRIWNFMYPYQVEEEPVFKSKCLTGNNFYWWNNMVRTPANINLPQAYYTYNIAPDNTKENLKYSFSDGRLTNRLKAPSAGDLANLKQNRALIHSGKLHRGLFADTWSNTAPLEIKFHFNDPVTIEKAVLLWNGELPSSVIICGDDGKTYPLKGGKTAGVLQSTVSLPSVKTRTLTIRIPERSPGAKLLLSEVELWGSDK